MKPIVQKSGGDSNMSAGLDISPANGCPRVLVNLPPPWQERLSAVLSEWKDSPPYYRPGVPFTLMKLFDQNLW